MLNQSSSLATLLSMGVSLSSVYEESSEFSNVQSAVFSSADQICLDELISQGFVFHFPDGVSIKPSEDLSVVSVVEDEDGNVLLSEEMGDEGIFQCVSLVSGLVLVESAMGCLS